MAANETQRSTAASRAANDQGDNSRAQGGNKTRRRTKTGCLTCRKRRIKCDEGRPTCNNCFKSKRQCEGYQPSPMRFPSNGNEYSQHLVTMPYQPHPSDARQPANHSHILPRPPHRGSFHSEPNSALESPWAEHAAYMHETDFDQPDMASIMMAANQASPSATAYINNFPDIMQNARAMQPMLSNGMSSAALGSPSGSFVQGSLLPHGFHEQPGMQYTNGSVNLSDFGQFMAPNPVSPEGFVWNPHLNAYDQRLYTSMPPEQFDFNERFAEDEIYDIGSDDEELNGASERNEHASLPLMMAVHPNFDVRALRTHDTFLNTPNILVHYEPQWRATPLSDPTAVRIFGHFIAVTACHLSLGQRRASNPSLLFQQAVPKSQQGLWTYILPQKALTNEGLMHAMLALASLQIAMLQGTDRHTARKHYHFAIRRNKNAVGSSRKRTSIATIATTLLLGSFEVWAADHSNWNSHLIGARQLLLEADFVKQSRQIKEHRYQAAPVVSPDDPYSLYLQQKVGPVLQADLPDEDFLERITGFTLPYSDRVEPQDDKPSPPLSQQQIDSYDTYADLYWFFLKQDIYYSTISSNPLLLPYSRWADCPPRAPMGKLDAIYGTSDHLILIYGRIAKFISDDLVRKKKAVQANGGQWRPPAGMSSGGGSGQAFNGPSNGRPPGGMPGGGAGLASPQGPSFMGMIPPPPTPRMPAAFKESMQGAPYMPTPKDEREEREEEDIGDLSVAFKRAMAEWNDIQAVLKEFEAALQAVEWQPLPIQTAMPIATHFGSALQYGDYRIADTWAMYYTAKIILARVHPAMPPAALMAAAVCAQQTAEWANTIGKIVFGMQTPANDEPLNPTFASVLTQNMYCLFFAGVQYSEPAQRIVCVQRLRYIAEKVGHETSVLVAAALETCWINAFQMGRGPKWLRTIGLALDAGDENRKTEFRTMERKKDGPGATVYIRNDELRTQFGMGVMGLESDFGRLNVRDNYGFGAATNGK